MFSHFTKTDRLDVDSFTKNSPTRSMSDSSLLSKVIDPQAAPELALSSKARFWSHTVPWSSRNRSMTWALSRSHPWCSAINCSRVVRSDVRESAASISRALASLTAPRT